MKPGNKIFQLNVKAADIFDECYTSFIFFSWRISTINSAIQSVFTSKFNRQILFIKNVNETKML